MRRPSLRGSASHRLPPALEMEEVSFRLKTSFGASCRPRAAGSAESACQHPYGPRRCTGARPCGAETAVFGLAQHRGDGKSQPLGEFPEPGVCRLYNHGVFRQQDAPRLIPFAVLPRRCSTISTGAVAPGPKVTWRTLPARLSENCTHSSRCGTAIGALYWLFWSKGARGGDCLVLMPKSGDLTMRRLHSPQLAALTGTGGRTVDSSSTPASVDGRRSKMVPEAAPMARR